MKNSQLTFFILILFIIQILNVNSKSHLKKNLPLRVSANSNLSMSDEEPVDGSISPAPTTSPTKTRPSSSSVVTAPLDPDCFNSIPFSRTFQKYVPETLVELDNNHMFVYNNTIANGPNTYDKFNFHTDSAAKHIKVSELTQRVKINEPLARLKIQYSIPTFNLELSQTNSIASLVLKFNNIITGQMNIRFFNSDTSGTTYWKGGVNPRKSMSIQGTLYNIPRGDYDVTVHLLSNNQINFGLDPFFDNPSTSDNNNVMEQNQLAKPTLYMEGYYLLYKNFNDLSSLPEKCKK